MPDRLYSIIAKRTAIPERYKEHAAHQSMSAFLDDWEDAHARLGRAITRLRLLRDAREAETSPWCRHCNDEGVVHDMAGNMLGPCDCSHSGQDIAADQPHLNGSSGEVDR